MKTYLFLLLFLLGCSSAANGQTSQKWKFSSFTVSGTKPGGATWNIQVERLPTGTTTPSFSGLGGQSSANTLTNYSVAGKLSTNNSTCTSCRIVFGHTLSGVFTPVKWVQAQPETGGDPQKEGPYTGGVPTTPEGDPVDDSGNPTDPPDPERYYAEANWLNTHKFPVTVSEVWVAATGETLFGPTSHSVPPGATHQSSGYCDQPFSIHIHKTADGMQVEPDLVVDGEPVDPDDPEHPDQPEDGQPGGKDGPPKNTGGGGAVDVGAPDPVTPEPRPGDGEGNAEARHKELVGEIRRGVQATVDGTNKANQNHTLTNSLLGDMSETIEGGIGDIVGAIGEGNEGEDQGNQYLKEIRDSLVVDDFEEPETPEPEPNPANAILNSMGGLKEAVGTLSTSLNLSDTGQASLSWTINLPTGSATISAEPYSASLNVVRTLILWLAGLFFALAMIRTFRGAFADGD